MEQNTTLDPIDLRLLDLLQRDAGQTNLQLAAAAHVSAATALRRVKRMEDAGLIQRRVALLAPRWAGVGLTALIEISLDRQGAEHLSSFEALAVADASVQQVWRVSPGPDFVLVAWTPDMAGYQALAQRLFTQTANVRNVKAYFATQQAKFEPRIDLGAVRATAHGP